MQAAPKCRGRLINPSDKPTDGKPSGDEPKPIPADFVDSEIAEHHYPVVDSVLRETLAEEDSKAGIPDGEGPGELPGSAATARNTAIFGSITGLSRIAGLAREVLAAKYFGTSGPASAFTLAFLIPNTVRSLFADSALSAAFIPVFSEELDKGKKREAYRLASTLFLIMFGALGALTILFILTAGVIVPLFTPSKIADAGLDSLTVGLSQVLFPIVLILGLNGLVVGILQAYDKFTIPALSALVWNVVIMTIMVGTRPLFHGNTALYGYAIGILIGTIVQFAMALPVLRSVGFKFEFSFDWRDPRVKQVFALMLPVTLGLGLINLNLFANAYIGGEISDAVPRAIDQGFRIYMLPQGIFSVAISTVLFPQLARLASRNDLRGVQDLNSRGLRIIFLMLLPATAALIVLPEPITQLVYQRGNFNAASTTLVATGLFWFAFSLPFSGVNLLLTRTFFGLKRPWVVTGLSVGNLIVNIGVSIALIPQGIAGVVIGTVVADALMAAAQFWFLGRLLGRRLELRELFGPLAKMLVAAAAFGGVAYATWSALDSWLGESLIDQMLEVGLALTAGAAIYAFLILQMKIPEAQRIQRLVMSRLRPSS